MHAMSLLEKWLQGNAVIGHQARVVALLRVVATSRQWVRHFQANTERRRPVLSTVFLGQELWRNHRFKVRLGELFGALKRLRLLVIQEASYA